MDGETGSREGQKNSRGLEGLGSVRCIAFTDADAVESGAAGLAHPAWMLLAPSPDTPSFSMPYHILIPALSCTPSRTVQG